MDSIEVDNGYIRHEDENKELILNSIGVLGKRLKDLKEELGGHVNVNKPLRSLVEDGLVVRTKGVYFLGDEVLDLGNIGYNGSIVTARQLEILINIYLSNIDVTTVRNEEELCKYKLYRGVIGGELYYGLGKMSVNEGLMLLGKELDSIRLLKLSSEAVQILGRLDVK